MLLVGKGRTETGWDYRCPRARSIQLLLCDPSGGEELLYGKKGCRSRGTEAGVPDRRRENLSTSKRKDGSDPRVGGRPTRLSK